MGRYCAWPSHLRSALGFDCSAAAFHLLYQWRIEFTVSHACVHLADDTAPLATGEDPVNSLHKLNADRSFPNNWFSENRLSRSNITGQSSLTAETNTRTFP